jgi:hypothetical protein
MSDDYGFYGKGTDGYVHYMQAVDASQKGRTKKPKVGCGCLIAVVTTVIITIIAVFSIILCAVY